MTEDKHNDRHVGELLSGYLDGELTQQDRQRVRLHCESCEECSARLQEIRALSEHIGKASLSDVGQDVWREAMDDNTVKVTRGAGWLLLVVGAVIAGGALVYEIFASASSFSMVEKLFIGGIYGGLLLLLISVLRQRLIERKSDKYKDVEI